MKRNILLAFILILVVGSTVYSQEQLTIGVKGGLNLANVSITNSSAYTYNSLTGYHAGAFLLIKLSKIGIQPEILFSRQGTYTTFNSTFNSTDLNARYDYINVPVIIKLYIASGINFQVGPQVGFLVSAKDDQPNFDINGKLISITSDDIKDQLKSSDFSAALGLGWDAPFGLTVDARYNLGLSKIYNVTGSADAKNQVIQVSVGFKLFRLGK